MEKDPVAEVLQSFRERAERCKKTYEELPRTEGSVRTHVRLRAKEDTYTHCAHLLEEALNRKKGPSCVWCGAGNVELEEETGVCISCGEAEDKASQRDDA